MQHIPNQDTPLTRCAHYRDVCGLPAIIDPPSLGRITFPAGHIGALTMPAPLGETVRQHMKSRGAAVGPIIGHIGSNRWTYLVRPNVPEDDTRVFSDMYRANVIIVRAGVVVLPSPTAQSWALRRWIEPPRNTFRPSALLVVETIRMCTGSDRDSRTLVMPRVR
ncbi:DNA-directed RNA polymerase subunit beta [Nocardia brasiliensis]|nr:DNA-directed RNA polymerase subunit beta [Nocardia brasiliensis]